MGSVLSRLDELRSLVGGDFVREIDSKIVASPRTTEEVATITRYANENTLAIEITGAGTKRGWGNTVAADIVLDTTGLAGVRQHSWQDLTATVGAGTPWAAMQKALASHNQYVALDPLWPDTATVGGIIATNDSGALRLKYGSLRDLIIGMTIVLADGTIAKSGGKVVKNVAGYDLHKLMTGAFGTLGVITEVTFRLHPLPSNTGTWTITSSNAEPIGELMMKVLDSQLSLEAMQMRARPEGYALDVKLACLPEVLTVQMEALTKLSNTVTHSDSFTEQPALAHSNPFTASQELMSLAGGVAIKATMLPSRITKLSMDVVRLGGAAVTQATGIMFARFSEEAAVTALPSLYGYVDAAGDGSLTILRAPNYPLPAWAIPPWGVEKAMPLMHEIKRRFDPNRILNPGCFLGGI